MVLLLREVNYSKFQRWAFLPCSFSSWLCLQLFLHLVFIQSGMLVVVMGLSLKSISVPQSGINGNSVRLGCEYQLDDEGEKLFSLKWYKDGHEFFRFMPHSSIPTQNFALPGVQVENNEYRTSNTNRVNRVVFTLKNLRLSSGGTYKCEISADAPTFKTLSKESNLTVIQIPDPPVPHLKNFPQESYLGGRIRGNCSFHKSHPAAKLTFYVNGAKVNNSEDIKLKMYDPRVDGEIEDYLSGGSSSMNGGSSSNGIGRQYQYRQQNQQISSSSVRRDGISSSMQLGSIGGGGISSGIPGSVSIKENTYTSVTGIDFRLDKHHFLQRGQLLTIRCVATVVDQMWDTQTNITIQNFQPPKLSSTGQNRYASGSVLPSFASQTARLGLLAITWIILSC